MSEENRTMDAKPKVLRMESIDYVKGDLDAVDSGYMPIGDRIVVTYAWRAPVNGNDAPAGGYGDEFTGEPPVAQFCFRGLEIQNVGEFQYLCDQLFENVGGGETIDAVVPISKRIFSVEVTSEWEEDPPDLALELPFKLGGAVRADRQQQIRDREEKRDHGYHEDHCAEDPLPIQCILVDWPEPGDDVEGACEQQTVHDQGGQGLLVVSLDGALDVGDGRVEQLALCRL